MLFNSIDFAIFLPVVFLIYWFILGRNLKLQNLFVVFSSYVFYGWWDWRFLFLMALTTLFSWLSGILMLNVRQRQKGNEETILRLISTTNIVLNLSILIYFKYFGFFVENFVEAFRFFGRELSVQTLNIVLPVGISFYTFQALSYTIDIYRKKLEPTKDIISFFAYVSFFPQLVAGPIERATHLLPQFYTKRVFIYQKAVDGMRQILWGLFKKIVIADNCAEYANLIFNNSDAYPGSILVLGALFFTFQIYCDFSGYSDIAIGTSRLFGIDIMRNFNFPYFARDIAEFWRRWHISLTTWFRDYLYIPLGGSRGSKVEVIRNTFIIFLVSGFWHGANWTFIIWGGYHALLFLPLILLKVNRKHTNSVAEGRLLPRCTEMFQMVLTFSLVVFGWIFFRANDLDHALSYISTIFSPSLFSLPENVIGLAGVRTLGLVCAFVIVEWLGRDQAFAIERLGLGWKRPLRYAMYYFIIIAIFWFGGKEQQFIYFQF